MHWFETVDTVDTSWLHCRISSKQLFAIINHQIQIRTKVFQIWSGLIVHKCLWNIIWGISVSISEFENCFQWRTIISIIRYFNIQNAPFPPPLTFSIYKTTPTSVKRQAHCILQLNSRFLKVSRIEDRDASDCQLTFERYCT